MTPSSHGYRFLKQHHLRRGADFQRVYQRRRTASDAVIVVHACENDLTHPRLGLSVSRKVGGAVERNRWKRLLREAFRLQLASLPMGIDLVVVPRSGIEPNLAALSDSLFRLAWEASRKLRRR